MSQDSPGASRALRADGWGQYLTERPATAIILGRSADREFHAWNSPPGKLQIAPEVSGVQIRENTMLLAQHRTKVGLAVAIVLITLLLALALSGGGTVVRAQATGGPPPASAVYAGDVTVGGSAAPDGLAIVGRVVSDRGEEYQSKPRITRNGTYNILSYRATQ